MGVWGLRAHPRSLDGIPCEPSEHDFDHGEFDEGDGTPDVPFIVSGEPPAVADPGECALDDPPFGQDDEPGLALRAFYNVESSTAYFRKCRGYPRQLIAAIGEKFLDRGMLLQRRLHHRKGADAVLYIGGLDLQAQQHT